MMRSLLFSAIAFFFLTASSSNLEKYPQDYFRSPVNFKIRLSGTFGELRPNHFHAGIDIKSSNGQTGDPLFAVADGTISRIKVQSAGYGNVLYMRHPNGYTSVYAHLKKFPADIADYVRKQQYAKKSFAVDLYPKAGTFSFQQGEQIGVLGTSGRSYGPHLHFEIRDSKTEKPINPQLFGIGKEDNKYPKLHSLRWYGLNDRKETLSKGKVTLIDQGNHTYRIKGDTLSLGAWRTGLALKAFDHSNGVTNWNGIYSLEVLQDGKKIYAFDMETFGFPETRYINAHLDYQEQVENKSYYHRCFRLPGNKLSIYENPVEDGILTLYKSKPSKIEMIVKDVAGNTSTLWFWVKRKKVPETAGNSFEYVFKHNEPNVASGDGWRINMKANSLYEDLYWKHDSKPQPEKAYSRLHIFHDGGVPVHRYFTIAIRPDALPENLRDKAIIAYKNKKGDWQSSGGKWEGDFLTARVRNLGAYCVMADQKKPTVAAVSFKKDLRGASKMSFKVTDDVDAAKNIDSFSYEASIDGQWALFEYDAKNDLLTHRFAEGELSKGEHVLKLTVKDAVGNETVYQRVFLR